MAVKKPQSNERVPEFSDIKPIQSVITTALLAINRAGIMVSLKQMIPYGTQLFLEGQGENGLINIYFSKKKGLSFVDCSDNTTSAKTIEILREGPGNTGRSKPPDIGPKERQLNTWIGTDESGKGDFFGPLVVAGFFMTKGIEKEILQMGITDSKKLASKEIRRIAEQLQKKFARHISIVAPSNETYNQLYTKFNNLNKLLAWGHARVIQNLIGQWQNTENVTIDGVVSDQFGKKQHILNALSSMKKVNLIQRHKAESNTAVAAASIIARDCFEQKMAHIQQQSSVKIPFGAGAGVVKAAKLYAQKYGREKLELIAKIHFKTYQQI